MSWRTDPSSGCGSEFMRIFFYGLFMDEAVLASKDVRPAETSMACLDGFSLHIGERATLLPAANSRVCGVLMDVAAEDIASLYSEPSVAEYVAEPVVVTLPDNTRRSAVCYVLPAAKTVGSNPEYAAALLALAAKLDFPESYLEQIKNAVTRT